MNTKFKVSALTFLIIFLVSCEKKPTIPVLTTKVVTEITATSASSGGIITNDGGATIIQKGVCWSTSNNPTIESNPIDETGEPDSFTSNITGLSPKTRYYIRAYATNSAGTGYGESMVFTTQGDTPASVSTNVTNISVDSAILNGTVNPNSLSTAVSFEWGTTTDYGNTVAYNPGPITGNSSVDVSVTLTGLTPGTTYHFRVNATNELGTTNGQDFTFNTLGQVPAVTPLDATDITISSATLNGSVNPNFLPTSITIEWGTDYGYGNLITPTPNSLSGSTSVNVSATLSGLSEGTKYYYRITATNELGTTYGIGFTFTTFAKPNVETKDISEITTNSALVAGSIISDFGASVIEKGICWSNSHNPTTSDNKASSSLVGADFSVPITGLTPNSTYYLRAYAINSVGVGYGDELILKTYTGTVSDIDGNQYYTVTIGSQLWMAQNLKTTKYQNGALIGTTTPAQFNITDESNPEYQWAPGADENNVPTYGRLYTWYAITDSRNVCPLGWHIPTAAEWDITTNYLGGANVAGSKMREAGLLHYADNNSDATNESGFTALPSGYRNQEGYFGGMYGNAGFWTLTQFSSSEAISRHLDSGSSSIGVYSHFTKNFGFSVRCVKD